MTASEPPPDGPTDEGPVQAGPLQQESAGNADLRSFLEELAAPEPVQSPGGFSLASLFLLVTAAGVIALLARKIVETEIHVTVVVIHAVVGGFIGGIAGAIVGA